MENNPITSNEILEGNKLIAVFMGYIWFPYSGLEDKKYTNEPGWRYLWI